MRLAGLVELLTVERDLPDAVVVPEVLEEGYGVTAGLIHLEGNLQPCADLAIPGAEPGLGVGGPVVVVHLQLNALGVRKRLDDLGEV